jgi:hypothetical protein
LVSASVNQVFVFQDRIFLPYLLVVVVVAVAAIVVAVAAFPVFVPAVACFTLLSSLSNATWPTPFTLVPHMPLR